MALQVVHRLAHLPGAAVADVAGVHEVGAAGEDVGLQRHAELPAIVDDVHVVVRDAPRPDIEPQPFVELAHLRRRVHLLEHVAAAQRQAAPADAARRFQDHDVVAGAVELVGGAQPGDAGAEDRDRASLAGVARQPEPCRQRRRGFEEIEQDQRLIGRAGAAELGHGVQQAATGHGHASRLRGEARREWCTVAQAAARSGRRQGSGSPCHVANLINCSLSAVRRRRLLAALAGAAPRADAVAAAARVPRHLPRAGRDRHHRRDRRHAQGRRGDGGAAEGRRLPRRRHPRDLDRPAQGQPRGAAARHRRAQADPAARAYRRGAGGRRLAARAVQAHRGRRLFPRPRRDRRQGDGGDFRRQPDRISHGGLQAASATSSWRSPPTRSSPTRRTTASSGCWTTSAR